MKYFPKNCFILEAGCGPGHFVKYLCEKGYKVIGVEINKEVVLQCNLLEPDIDVRFGDVSNLKFNDNYFDGVMSLGVIEHFLHGPEKALNEMFRVLKPGGIGIISTPCFNYLRFIKKYTGLAYLDYYLRKLVLFIRGKKPFYYNNMKKMKGFVYKYNRWPVLGGFFEYRFTKKELENFIKKAGFKIVEGIELERLGGLYHELGGILVDLKNPSRFIKFINKLFSFIPFFNNHTYLCVLTKNK